MCLCSFAHPLERTLTMSRNLKRIDTRSCDCRLDPRVSSLLSSFVRSSFFFVRFWVTLKVGSNQNGSRRSPLPYSHYRNLVHKRIYQIHEWTVVIIIKVQDIHRGVLIIDYYALSFVSVSACAGGKLARVVCKKKQWKGARMLSLDRQMTARFGMFDGISPLRYPGWCDTSIGVLHAKNRRSRSRTLSVLSIAARVHVPW